MPVAVLILSHLARIQDMLLPNAGFMLAFKIFNIHLTNILCSQFTCKKDRFCLILTKINTQFVSTNQPQRFSKSSLGRFSICTTSLCWYRIYESSAYKRRVDVTTCGISLAEIRSNSGPKMDLCGALQKTFFPKLENC